MRRQQEGRESLQILQVMDKHFEKLQVEYHSAVVNKVRSGTEHEVYMEACKLAALDDLVTDLDNKVKTGARAQELATNLEAGSG